MANLYELTGEFLELQEMLENEEYDDDIVTDTLDWVEGEIEIKAENYAKIIRNLENDMRGYEEEEKKFAYKKKVCANRIKYLKQNLQMCMEATKKTKFKTKLFSFNIQNNGRRKFVVDVDVNDLPEEYRIKVPDEPNKEKLEQELKKKGWEVKDGSINWDYCHYEPQTKSLRIK